MWQEAIAPHLEAGTLQAIGIVQEQHPERAALYRQWRGFDWPLYVDALNLLDHKVVPIVHALDEAGNVVARLRRPTDLDDFLAREPVAAAEDAAALPPMPHPLDGDALFHFGDLDAAIEAYAAEPEDDARAKFRLGVALRRRFESDGRQPGDAQAAVSAWTRALEMDPSQYIWRRRIQQYGPRLDKPYNMYGWIEEARAAIVARGEEPLPLAVEPRGTELIGKRDTSTSVMPDFDPQGLLPRDDQGLVVVETSVTPARVRPGRHVRVRAVCRVGKAWWNNETEPLQLHAAAPEDWKIPEGTFLHARAEEAESRELRILEFEVQVPEDATAGPYELPVYVIYNVCEDEGGVCILLRQDLSIAVEVSPDAPDIQ